VSGTYHLTSSNDYQLSIADLVIKNNTTKQGQYTEGGNHATYHHQYKNPTRNAQSLHAIKIK
jgi:hypothetical protein